MYSGVEVPVIKSLLMMSLVNGSRENILIIVDEKNLHENMTTELKKKRKQLKKVTDLKAKYNFAYFNHLHIETSL